MDKQFNCQLCDKDFSSAFSLANHKSIYHANQKDNSRKKNANDNLYHCRHCTNKYKSYQARWNHESKCKFDSSRKDDIISKQKDEIIRLQKKLLSSNRLSTKTFKAVNKILIERSLMNSSHNNHSNNNHSNNNNSNNSNNSHNAITNNITNNNHFLCNFGAEDLLSVLTDEQKQMIIKSCFNSIEKLVEIAHCGEFNQFKNVIITNLKDDYAYKYDSNKGYFITVKKNELLDDIFNYRKLNIEEIYDELENGNRIDAKTKIRIKQFLDTCENDEQPYENQYGITFPNLKEYKKDNIKILLYNSHDKITRSIATLIHDDDDADTTHNTPFLIDCVLSARP